MMNILKAGAEKIIVAGQQCYVLHIIIISSQIVRVKHGALKDKFE